MSYTSCRWIILTTIISKRFCHAAIRPSNRTFLRRYGNVNANPPTSGWTVDPCIDFRELTDNFDAISTRLNRNQAAKVGSDVLTLLKSSLKEYESVAIAVDQLERARAKNAEDSRNAAAGEDKVMQSKSVEVGRQIKKELKVASAKKKELHQMLLNAALKLPNRLHPSTPTTIGFGTGSKTDAVASSARDCDFRNQFSFGRYAELELRLLNESCRHLENRGFQPVTPPDFLRSDVLAAAGLGMVAESFFTLLSKNELHKLKSEMSESPLSDDRAPKSDDHHEYVLVGPSALGLSGYLMRTAVPKGSMPLKLICSGRQHSLCRGSAVADATAFRKSSCVSLLVGTASSEELDRLYMELQDAVLQFLSSFNVPVQAKKLVADELDDHEAARWVVTATGKDKSSTIASLSYHYDYISRRLMTEVKDAALAPQAYLHTIGGYIVDASALISVIEDC